MAAEIEGILPKGIQEVVTTSKILVVGAGGIGCELLKNLVLTGFKNITILDLDTIEVSNLNRQFLFRKEHVGRPKATVAKESALVFNPNVDITAYHDSITETKYDVNFYKQFSVVMNALDNLAARSHVNRMCLAADLPLVESASAGFKGNVTCYKKGISECYNCTDRPRQKTFPGCTIRNTPSEPIHCIVWAKHLFNQLFGAADEDQDVSPDSADPEAIGDAGKTALESSESESSKAKVSTREWARSHDYDSKKLFVKFFHDDIKYLLSMSNLWVSRRAPTPLDIGDLPDAVASSSFAAPSNVGLKDQRIWTIAECEKIFSDAVEALKAQFKKGEGEPLIWDKDDDVAMDFVTACSNIRCHIFGIQQKSRFDTKSMAGNIIPAVASTNAIVAGLMVMLVFNVLRKQYDKVNTLYLSERLNVRKELFAIDRVAGPNPKCYVCREKPELGLKADLDRMTIRVLKEKVLQGRLNMIAPDVEIDGAGTILISSEEGDSDAIADKLLKDFNISDGTRLVCDDFFQNYQITITIVEMKEEEKENVRNKEESIFEVVGDLAQLNPKPEEATEKVEKQEAVAKTSPSTSNGKSIEIADGPSTPIASTSNSANAQDDEDDLSIIQESKGDEDDILLIEPVEETKEADISLMDTSEPPTSAKRPHSETPISNVPVKKRRVASEPENIPDNPEVVEID